MRRSDDAWPDSVAGAVAIGNASVPTQRVSNPGKMLPSRNADDTQVMLLRTTNHAHLPLNQLRKSKANSLDL